MNMIYACRSVSVTELKRSYAEVVAAAAEGPIAVLNHNRPEAYLVGADTFARMMELLEDLEDARLADERQNGPFIDADLNDLRTQISREGVEGMERDPA
jgi:antitoxin StbD